MPGTDKAIAAAWTYGAVGAILVTAGGAGLCWLWGMPLSLPQAFLVLFPAVVYTVLSRVWL